jgi:UDP-N-acetyl-D-galactosamine dehydrogenase
VKERLCVVGLGYVGLPVAMGFARHYPTIGFDIDEAKVCELKMGIDRTAQFSRAELLETSARFTSDASEIEPATFFIVAVPTPVDGDNRPDLVMLENASRIVGRALQPGAVVVYESTVYPGTTEEVCGSILEQVSRLRRGHDFKIAYSPERINPGDREHTFDTIRKVVSGEDDETLERVARVYESVITAGVHRAQSIKVAEAAKVIENTQRDVNIALMNEVALILDRCGISTRDVLAAAGTKWNFLPFTPGLVGGHCIGVDPYYLTTKAEHVGYYPDLILAGRRVNDGMGRFVAQKLVKLLIDADVSIKNARVGILGLTFKENIPDLRNSRVPDIVGELGKFGLIPLVHDELAPPAFAREEYGIDLVGWDDIGELDAVIVAVAHGYYVANGPDRVVSRLKPDGGIIVDVKSSLNPALLPQRIRYWSL